MDNYEDLTEITEKQAGLNQKLAAMALDLDSERAKNARLCEEVSRLKSLIGESGQELWSAENQRADRLEAELEQMKRELDTAKEHLAAYKDTGLAPKHIQGILGSLQFYMETISPVYAVEFKKFGIDRLHDLMQAEQDGRLVVLPCKVGDTLWTYANYPAKYVYPFRICDIQLTEKTMSTTRIGTIKWSDIGKTVFLTREEAGAALISKDLSFCPECGRPTDWSKNDHQPAEG